MAYKPMPLPRIARAVIESTEEYVDENQRLIVKALTQIAVKDYDGAAHTLAKVSAKNYTVQKALNLVLVNEIRQAEQLTAQNGASE